jgi:hypothetical protein
MKGEIVRITYRMPHTKELYDAALGIALSRKSISKSDKPIPTVRSRSKAFAIRMPIGAILALGCFLLAHISESLTQTHRTILCVCGVIVSIVALIDALLAFSYHKIFHTNFAVFQANDAMGESFLTVDETGVCDTDSNGNISKFAWSNYQSTVITKEAIVLLRYDNIFQILPYTEEFSSHLTEVLTAQGKGDTIYRRTIKH